MFATFPFHQKLPDFNPVNAGVRASIRCPIGSTYRQIIVKHTDTGTPANEATMIANIEEVSVKINGSKRISMTGATAVMLSKFYNKGIFNDGELVLDFTRAWARTMEGEDNLGWGTKNVSNMHLEIKIAAGATAPTLTADCVLTTDLRDLDYIVEVHEFPFEAISAGKKEIPDLPKQNGSLVALHLKSTTINALEVKLGKIPVIEDDTDLSAYQNNLVRIAGRTLQTGYVHIDAMQNNRIGDVWPLGNLQEFRVNPTVSAAGSMTIIMETLSRPLPPSK